MTEQDLHTCDDERLEKIDPVVLILTVAKGIPALSGIAIAKYQALVDLWTQEFRAALPAWEGSFHAAPQKWDNSIHLFRLGLLCYLTNETHGIRYKEDEKHVTSVLYTDPSDLFIHGVLDTRRGTCGNMAALHFCIAWRLGWPVSLATANWHQFLRFENGQVVLNIESSNTEDGGVRSHPDSYYLEKHSLTPEQVRSGSDLTFLTPRERLGLFIGARARHWHDIGQLDRAAADFRLASELNPRNWLWRSCAERGSLHQHVTAQARPRAPSLEAFVNCVSVGMDHFTETERCTTTSE